MATKFDFRWSVTWHMIDPGWEALGTAETADGSLVNIALTKKKTLDWEWLNDTPVDQRIPENEGDGTKGRMSTRRGIFSGLLHVRAVPTLEDWRTENFTMEFGFGMPDSLKPASR